MKMRGQEAGVPGTRQSNQTGEIFAINKAAQIVPPFAPLHIISDSKYAIEGLTAYLQDWSDKDMANANHFRAAAYRLWARSARMTFKWTKGHAGEKGNEGANKLAGKGAEKQLNEDDNLEILDRWNLTKAKLATITQALAYKGITAAQKQTEQKAAEHKDISRNISDFLWHIPDYEQRATCELCNVEDSIKHILTECDTSENKKAWLKKHNTWPAPHLGNIIGAPLAQFNNDEGRQKMEAAQFYRILMTELAHLIWKIHYDIDGRTHTNMEILKRWYAAMNIRLQLDCEMTKAKYNKKQLALDLVQQTWSELSKNKERLSPEWANMGFLVGMGPL
ncbi:ribonuclease H-like domain-containing protein [Irpex rosettiformis]|uniref:Ribonuclease H-like domain-containing protein n=1 Tax=Irpex rosettiformis TaxID=378272 RepID=A0ACB8TTF9_9APHY|nr:ribonuclease H-like domain-containing protein [Irpex rosettiformis]